MEGTQAGIINMNKLRLKTNCLGSISIEQILDISELER